MSQRATTIRISEPCRESWADMTAVSNGRHCAACAKTVVDFTYMTDAEILAYLKQVGAAASCGRFRAGQLARPLLPAVLPRPAQRWRGWVAAALALWGLRAEAAAPLQARPSSAQHLPHKQPSATPTRQVARRLVSGIVRDQYSQEPVAWAKVRVKGGHRTTTTDANGYFRLWLPARRGPHRQHALVVQQVGYAAYTVRVPLAARSGRAFRINLTPVTESVPPDLTSMMGGYESIAYAVTHQDSTASIVAPSDTGKLPTLPRRSWYQRLTQFFRHSVPTK